MNEIIYPESTEFNLVFGKNVAIKIIVKDGKIGAWNTVRTEHAVFPEQKLLVIATKMVGGQKYSCPIDMTGFPVEPSDSLLIDSLKIMRGAFDRIQEG